MRNAKIIDARGVPNTRFFLIMLALFFFKYTKFFKLKEYNNEQLFGSNNR